MDQELIDEDSYNGVRSDERVYLDLRASAGYTSEAEKLERNDSKINFFYPAKKFDDQKAKAKGMGLFFRWIPVRII